MHLHALFVELVAAAELKVVIALLDEPFADVTGLVLHDAALVNGVIFRLHAKVHLLYALRLELLRRSRWLNDVQHGLGVGVGLHLLFVFIVVLFSKLLILCSGLRGIDHGGFLELLLAQFA